MAVNVESDGWGGIEESVSGFFTNTTTLRLASNGGADYSEAALFFQGLSLGPGDEIDEAIVTITLSTTPPANLTCTPKVESSVFPTFPVDWADMQSKSYETDDTFVITTSLTTDDPFQFSIAQALQPIVDAAGDSFSEVLVVISAQGSSPSDLNFAAIEHASIAEAILEITLVSNETYNHTMTGGIRGGGACLVTSFQSKPTSGGAVAGSSALINSNQSKIPSGGAVASGTASLTTRDVVEVSGGAVLGGSADLSKRMTPAITGSALCGGTADVDVEEDFNEVMSGGAVCGGAAEWNVLDTFTETMTGGCQLAGQALVELNVEVTGGAMLGGSARVTTRDIVEVLGGIVAGGDAIAEHSIPGRGGIRGGSSADVTIFVTASTSGGLRIHQPMFSAAAPATTRVFCIVPRWKITEPLYGFPTALYPVCSRIPIAVHKEGRPLAFDVREFDEETGKVTLYAMADLTNEHNNEFEIFC